jgi:hypothetical protein
MYSCFLQNFEALAKNLTDLISAVEKKEGILEYLNPIYNDTYVKRAQMHADRLHNSVLQYSV